MSQSLGQLSVAHSKNVRLIDVRQKGLAGQQQMEVTANSKVNMLSTPVQSKPREFNREKMIQQNQKLKKQVLELAEHMDEILSKSSRKKKYGLNLESELEGVNQVHRLQAKKQEIRIMELRNQIFSLKKENEYVWDESAVIEKQNSIRALQAEMRPFEVEKEGMLKMRRKQEKAWSSLQNDDKYTEKVQKSRAQLSKLKQECKVLTSKTLENQKLLLRAHEKTVSKSHRIKQIEEKIRQNKEKIKKGVQNVVTIEMISEIEEEIAKLEGEYKQLQKSWTEKINNLQVQHSNRRAEQQKKLVILKDKQREVKLNDIRLKQYRKLIVNSRAQSKLQGESMSQYRNKRNIKYLEKSPQQ